MPTRFRPFPPASTLAALVLLALVPCTSSGALAAQAGPLPQRADRLEASGPVTPWPRPVPVRLKPSGIDDMLVTTLGEVSTPLADGTFDPATDRVTTRSGRVIQHYYEDSLGITHYRPIDKSVFPLPPSGWCSWYYYYRQITPAEILANARWMATHLGPYGANWIQIDDGWQGTGPDTREPRDPLGIDPRFAKPGMKALADSIRALGMEAGIWLAPEGQSNIDVVRRTGAFLTGPHGDQRAFRSWEGTYLLDPTKPAARTYLGDLFGSLRRDDFTYFKIDGQTVVLDQYAKALPWMAGPVPQGDRAAAAADVYRRTLGWIRDAIGPRSYLLLSWGPDLAGIGLTNGGRTADDVVGGWEGFLIAEDATDSYEFLNNVAWYSDPDALLVRPPLTDGTARAWATLYGLTGQALMASDRMTDLPASRVDVLKRVFPATDVRPLDLYRPDNVHKTIVDLKVSDLGRRYDVVGVFNHSTHRSMNRLLSWKELGLDANRTYHVYDFWRGVYLGAWDHGVFLNVPPEDVRVVTLVPATARPVLVSTSRHITQGWVSLVALSSGGTDAAPLLSGKSRVVAGDPYTLTFGLPPVRATYRIVSAEAAPAAGGPRPTVTFASHQGYATVTVTSSTSQTVAWTVRFGAAEAFHYPVGVQGPLAARQRSVTSVDLTWPTEYYLHAGYRVDVDGRPVGVTFQPWATVRDLSPGRVHTFEVHEVWTDGTVSRRFLSKTITLAVPDSTPLSEMEPAMARQGRGMLGRNRSFDGNELSVAGLAFGRGLGTVAPSEVEYRLAGVYGRFTARVGIDDEAQPAPAAAARFEVLGDGRVLWTSPPMHGGEPPLPVEVDVKGVEVLSLRVLPAGTGDPRLHADWLRPRVLSGP